MFNKQQTEVPGFDVKEFKEMVKEYAESYDSIVRDQKDRSQDTAPQHQGSIPPTGKSVLGLTEEQYRQFMEDQGY